MSTVKEQRIPKEMSEEEILAKINESLARLGVSAEIKSAPRTLGVEALEGRSIVILDDDINVLTTYIPAIISATKGEGSFVRHKGESSEVTASEILEQNPEAVLLDFKLAGNITGADVANALREKGYSGILVGFSSVKEQGAFPADKMDGVVLKNVTDVANSLRGVAKVVSLKS